MKVFVTGGCYYLENIPTVKKKNTTSTDINNNINNDTDINAESQEETIFLCVNK